MTYKEAAARILADAAKPLHYMEILSKALDRGLIVPPPTAKTPHNTMNAAITADIKHGSDKSTFVRRGSGVFGLRERPGRRRKPRDSESSVPNPPAPEPQREEQISSRSMGKAGEYTVMAEMLFRGYNVYVPAVDEGIDVIATKNRSSSNIQVKTANKKAGKYGVSFKIKSFERAKDRNTFYIFVLRDGEKTEFIILSHFDMLKGIETESIKSTSGGYYSTSLSEDNGSMYMGGKSRMSVEHNRNNWKIIE